MQSLWPFKFTHLFAYWVIFHAFSLSADFFHILKKFFKEYTIRVSNGFDPDQDPYSDGPNLGPNCFQKLSADGKSYC